MVSSVEMVLWAIHHATTLLFGVFASAALCGIEINRRHALELYKDDEGNSIRAKVFSRIWHDFYDYFNINAYANLPRVRFKEAIEYINRWQPPTNMQLEIGRINREIA